MSLAEYYRQQFRWRRWPAIFEAVADFQRKTVLDMGCGVGDQAAELAVRGARVIGFGMNEEVLEAARARGVPGAEFMRCDLRAPPELGLEVDGIWCSFSAAYFPDLPAVLTLWSRSLRAGGWLAITEIDDLFGHIPMSARAASVFSAYAADALAAGRYDFHMGRKLPEHMERVGFTVTRSFSVHDDELSFDGPARPDVLVAWRTRLEGMTLFRDFCGPDFSDVRDEFLRCLSALDHRSVARVQFVMAVKSHAA